MVTSESKDGKNIIANQVTPAENAQYTINGIADSSSSNKIDAIPGLTINLEKKRLNQLKLQLKIQTLKNPLI